MKAKIVCFDEGVEALLLIPTVETTFFEGDAVAIYDKFDVPFVARCFLLSRFGVKRDLIVRDYVTISGLSDGVKKLGFSKEDYEQGVLSDTSDIPLSAGVIDELLDRLAIHCCSDMSWLRPYLDEFIECNGKFKARDQIDATSIAIKHLVDKPIGLVASLASRYVKMFLESCMDGSEMSNRDPSVLIESYGLETTQKLVQSINSLTNLRNIYRGNKASRTITTAAFAYMVLFSVRLFVAGLSDEEKSLECLLARCFSLLLPTSFQVEFLECKTYADYTNVLRAKFSNDCEVAQVIAEQL